MRGPPLLHHAPRPPFHLMHGPKFMHPMHLEIMLLKRPKLLRKYQQAKLKAYGAATQDYDQALDEYQEESYFDYDQYLDDEDGDYYFEEDDQDIVEQRPFMANVNMNDMNNYYYADYDDEEEEVLAEEKDKWIDDADGASWIIQNE